MTMPSPTPEALAVLEQWDRLNTAIDRMLTALPWQMTEAAKELEGEKLKMRTAIQTGAVRSLATTQSQAREEMLREALEAIVARGPERDLKWAGMSSKDIAIYALSRQEGEGEG